MDHPADRTRPDQPLHDPLPYGLGFHAPENYGFGVDPEPTTPSAGVQVVETPTRHGSPVLAVAGLLSLGVAVWAILGAPMLSATVVVAGALGVLVLAGLIMVVRR